MSKQTSSKKTVVAETHKTEDTTAKTYAGKFNSITMRVAAPGLSPWLKVTCLTDGYFMFVPLPIRLIQQIPDEKGGGCIVRGAHGDDVATKDNIVEILGSLGGYPIGGSASVWALAS